ncbi:MAG: carboxypeptidase regulatory-like domain-containing protein [Clostridia bacterium]|nr:carboxypeptidase regulatory-like domain-containing protein [Clostridia bacterium]
MKSIYRILALILALSLIVGIALVAISCDGGDGADGDGTNTPGEGDGGNGGNDGGNDGGDGENGGNDGGTDGGNDNVIPEPETVDHTLTLVDNNGDPVVGVSVSIVISGEEPEAYYTTDEDGKVTVAVEKTMKRIIAVFEDGLVGYQLPAEKDCKFGLDETTLTIELVKLKAYTVRVLDASGAPVAGATVQLCYGENCLAETTTDENGEYTAYLNFDGTPKAIVKAISSEYIYFEEGETVLEVTIPAAE